MWCTCSLPAGGCIRCWQANVSIVIGRLPAACSRRGLMVAQARPCGVHPHVGVPGIDWMKHPLLLGKGPLSEFHLAILPSHQPLLCFHKEAQSYDKGQDKLRKAAQLPPPTAFDSFPPANPCRKAQLCYEDQDKLQFKCRTAAQPPTLIPIRYPLQGGTKLLRRPRQAAQAAQLPAQLRPLLRPVSLRRAHGAPRHSAHASAAVDTSC